jgi:hypothetical protein
MSANNWAFCHLPEGIKKVELENPQITLINSTYCAKKENRTCPGCCLGNKTECQHNECQNKNIERGHMECISRFTPISPSI